MKAYHNEVVMFTKITAVVSVITVVDLTAVANELFELTYDPFTPILTAAAFYWVLINLIRAGFHLLERHLSRHLIADEERRAAAAQPSVAGAGYVARWKAPKGLTVSPKEHVL